MSLIYGVGINDLTDHRTQICEYYKDEQGKSKRKVVWSCPFYTTWFNMIVRCYSDRELQRHPTYEQKFVCESWLTFSNFKKWMEKQDWEGKQLDKDILFHGNMEYCEEKCCFVTQAVNKFVLEKTAYLNKPRGTSFHKQKQKYQATVSMGKNGKVLYLGQFDTEKEAHLAWATKKLELAKDLASKETDERIAEALVNKYTLVLNKAKENM